MATVVWALRRSEATNGRVGLVTIADDELAGQLLKKGEAQPLRGGRLQRADPAWPDGLREKLASGEGKAKKRGRPAKAKAEGENELPLDPKPQPEPVKEKPAKDEPPKEPAPDAKAAPGKAK